MRVAYLCAHVARLTNPTQELVNIVTNLSTSLLRLDLCKQKLHLALDSGMAHTDVGVPARCWKIAMKYTSVVRAVSVA